MDLYSDFCNICYKADQGSLKHISAENLKHLKDTLITFVGHADIINHNIINLCHLCCEELTRSNKFREMCFTNLIQFRQRVFDMKYKLELEGGTCNVQKTLQIFIREDLRRNTLEKNNCAVSKPVEYEIVKSSADLSINESDFNRQKINLESETNECKFIGDCSDVATECHESQVQFTNFMFVKCEKESDEDYEFMKDQEDFSLRNFSSESGGHVNFDVEVSLVNNDEGIVNLGIESSKEELYRKQENHTSENLKLETNEDESGDKFKFAFETVKIEDCETTSSSNEENALDDMNLPTRNKSAVINAGPSRPHVQEVSNRRCPTALQSPAHKRITPALKPYTCAVCNKSFRARNKLIRHERIHSGDKPYKCTICNKAFTESYSLIVHERIHSGAKPYKCTVCNKAFMRSGDLTVHERLHSGDRPYKCNVCNKAFIHSCNLSRHELIHTGDKPYKCTVCNKAFMRSGDLAGHARIHSGDRPYKCVVCNKAFTQSSTLSVHKRTHSGEKPYKCTVCGKLFINSSNLITHKRTHNDGSPFKFT